MAIELKVPAVGESITEVEIGQWLKDEGEWAEKDEPVVEIETEKATVELPAPKSGTVSKVLKKKGEAAAVNEVIGYLEEGQREEVRPAPKEEEQRKEKPREAAGPRVMPAARRALAEHGLEADQVTATGLGGRLLKEDVERHARREGDGRQRVAEAPAKAAREEVVPMSPLRRRVAERLVEAQQTAALLTTFNEIDMSAVKRLRAEYQEAFQKKYGVKLGFMSFFVKAAIEALKLIPQLNAEIRGTDIVYRNYFEIGIAVSGGKGLVVPVLRDPDRLSFAEIETSIDGLAGRARNNKLKLEELEGGTFTITNGGIFGSLLSTPIVNPPQSGILGLHAIQDRPVAQDGQVVIRPMMYVALTYDHRIVDGREAVLFLRHIKEVVEDPSRILLEV